MKKIILVGGGGHCKSCIDVIETKKRFSIIGIVDNYTHSSCKLLGYPIIGTDDYLPKLIKKSNNFLITIGQIKEFKVRLNIFQYLINLGANFPIIESKYSYKSKHSTIGIGTILMHHSIINSNVDVGKNCIINSKSLIEHDSKVGDNCHISTGVVINGGVTVGSNSFIGSNTTIKQGVVIGKNVVIRAGSYVSKNVPDGETVL